MNSPVVIVRRAPVREDAARALAAGLAPAGWEPRAVDIDLVAARVVVELHRYDGRWIRLHADTLGRASLERWHRNERIVRAFNDGPEVNSHEDRFLGRSRCEGPRAGLRRLCQYVADNPCSGREALSAADVRALVAPLMGAL